MPAGPLPEFGLYLSEVDPRAYDWPSEWVRWRKYGLPRERTMFETALAQAWRRCADERVEIASSSGRGRTGLALACLAVLDGADPAEAVRIVKAQFENWTVGTPLKRLFIGDFA